MYDRTILTFMTNTRKNILSWIGVGACVLVIGGVIVVGRNHLTQPPRNVVEQPASSKEAAPVQEKQSASFNEGQPSSKLMVDLAAAYPQFVDDEEVTGNPLPVSLSKIKEDIRAIVSPNSTDDNTSEFYRIFKLRAVGSRYVVYEDFPMKMVESTADIFDAQTNKKTGQLLYPPVLRTSGGIQIHQSSSDNSLCIYRLDQPTCEYLANSRLESEGIYNKSTGIDVGGVEFDVVQHADTFTIGTYDWQEGVPVKIGERTFTIP